MATLRSLGRKFVTISLSERDVAARHRFQTGQQPQRCRLSAPAGADQHQEFTIADRKAGVGNRHLLAEALDQITGDNRAHLARS